MNTRSIRPRYDIIPFSVKAGPNEVLRVLRRRLYRSVYEFYIKLRHRMLIKLYHIQVYNFR